MSTRKVSRWRNRQEDLTARYARNKRMGDGFRGMAPKLSRAAEYMGCHVSDASRWARALREGPLSRCGDAIVAAATDPKGSPGSFIAAAMEIAVEAMATLDPMDLDARIVAAARAETEAEGAENVAEFELLNAIGTDRFVEVGPRYLDASRSEVAPQLDTILSVAARLRQMGVES